MKKGQIIFIHGGDSFATSEAFYEYLKEIEYEPHGEQRQRWRDDVQAQVEAAGYEWLFLAMPNKQNADYEAWKIWFAKVTPFIEADNSTQIIGYSLGACFLLRYLSENEAPFKIDQLHLVAPATSGDTDGLGSFAADLSLAENISRKADAIDIYHSKDDPICPYTDSQKIAQLVSGSVLHTFTDRNHFIQADFPELIDQLLTKIEIR